MTIMRPLFFYCILLLACSGFRTMAQQPAGAFVKVSGEVKTPLSLYGTDLQQMKRTSVTLNDRDGVAHIYKGVALQEILERAGVTMGRELRGENLAKFLLVKSADGYEVVFSLAELDSSFTDRIVILADEMDGRPVPEGRGPFRLVVPGEKKPARSSFQVVEFIVRFAGD